MHPHLAAARPPLSPAALLALGLCLAVAALLVAHGPIAQLANYHGFADTRGATWLPNVANVLSNLPFLLVGAVGWWRLRGAGQAPGASAWRVAAIGIALTAFGSTAYHASPSNDTLVLDRLPIAWACAALGCAFAAERFDRRWASRPALAAALALATAAVMHWWLTERGGQGDLRAYLAVQFLPMLVVPAVLWAQCRHPSALGVSGGGAWWAALGLYAVAKALELADHTIWEATGWVSGHTLKHLLAALAGGVLLQSAANAARGARH